MFKELWARIKSQKSIPSPTIKEEPVKEKPNFEITISSLDNDIFKMEISDYISLPDYFEKMKLIDYLIIEPLISNSALWNSRRQKVNQGTYFIIVRGNFLYNILINEEFIIIDERIKIDDITEERILSYEKDTNYGLTLFKHNKAGSTFYTKYYSHSSDYGKLALTKEEFLQELSALFSNLKTIEGITNILDLDSIRKNIFDDSEISRQRKKD